MQRELINNIKIVFSIQSVYLVLVLRIWWLLERYVGVAIGGVLKLTLRAWVECHFELGNLRISNYCLNLMFFLAFVAGALE